MKKLNLKSFFKKVQTTHALNRLSDTQFAPIDNNIKPKEKVRLLSDHIKNMDIEARQDIIKKLSIVYNLIDKESVKIAKSMINKIDLSSDSNIYDIYKDDMAYIISTENDIDYMIQVSIASSAMAQDIILISDINKKKNWKSFNIEANTKKSISDKDVNKDVNLELGSSNHNLLSNNTEMLCIELLQALKEVLSQAEDMAEHSIKILEHAQDKHTSNQLIIIENSKDNKSNFYISHIADLAKVIINGKGDMEKLFTIAECAMRIVYGIDTNPEQETIDLSQFKVKGDSAHPLRSDTSIKSWKARSIDISNMMSKESLSIKLRPSVNHNGMTQVWDFLAALGDIKNLDGYEVTKLNILFEINNPNSDKGYEKLAINLNTRAIDLNLLSTTHKIIYKLLKSCDIII